MNLFETTSAHNGGRLTNRGAEDGTGLYFYSGSEGVIIFHDQACAVLGTFLYCDDVQSWHLYDADEIQLSTPTVWDYFLDVSAGGLSVASKGKRAAPVLSAAKSTQILDSATRLGRIRHYFGLNTSELAEVMRVERPTIYAWLDGGKIRAANLERLAVVYACATKWWKLCPIPLGPSLYATSDTSVSVYSLLCAEVLAEPELEALFVLLAEGLNEKTRQPDGGFNSFARRAVARGLAEAPQYLQRKNIRNFGGRKKPG